MCGAPQPGLGLPVTAHLGKFLNYLRALLNHGGSDQHLWIGTQVLTLLASPQVMLCGPGTTPQED